jgi:hypothetical protein
VGALLVAHNLALRTQYVRGADVEKIHASGRRDGDAHIDASLVIAAVVSIIAVVLGALIPDHVHGPYFVALSLAFALALGVVVASSMWDWWWIIPRMQGLFDLPLCRSVDPGRRRSRALSLTKTRCRHRLIAYLAVLIAVALVIPTLLAWLADSWALGATLAGVLALGYAFAWKLSDVFGHSIFLVGSIFGLILRQSQLVQQAAKLFSWSVSGDPPLAFGDVILRSSDRRRFVVLDVDVNCIYLAPEEAPLVSVELAHKWSVLGIEDRLESGEIEVVGRQPEAGLCELECGNWWATRQSNCCEFASANERSQDDAVGAPDSAEEFPPGVEAAPS